MAQDTPSRKLDQYIVRFPDGMRDRLKEAAAANNRSLNAEIIARLVGYEIFRQNEPHVAVAMAERASLSKEVVALGEEVAVLRKDLSLERVRYEEAQISKAKEREAFEREIRDAKLSAIPESLRNRIERRAAETGRLPHEEIALALETAFPPPPKSSLHEFYEQWMGSLEVARGGTREKMIGEANSEAEALWPDRQVGFHLDGDVVRFSVSKKPR